MLHSQANSKRFIRHTRYWDAKNKAYAAINKPGLTHVFTELSPIQESFVTAFFASGEPFKEVQMEEAFGTTRTPKRLSNPPPITVGRVTTRHPSTTVEGKLPKNTFYRGKDGRLSLGNGPRKLNLIGARKVALLKRKSEETGCAIHLRTNSKARVEGRKTKRTWQTVHEAERSGVKKCMKEKERLCGGRNIRARATQMVRSRSDEKIFTTKTLGAIKSKKRAQNIEPEAASKTARLGKPGERPNLRFYDANYPETFGGIDFGNRSPISMEDVLERKSMQKEYLKVQKKKAKKTKASKKLDGSIIDNHFDPTDGLTDRNTSLDVRHACFNGHLVGNPALLVTFHDPPAKPTIIATEQYVRDLNQKTPKPKQRRRQKEKRDPKTKHVKKLVHGIRLRHDWGLVWAGTKKCCQAAWHGTQGRSHAMMKRIGQAKKVLTSGPIMSPRGKLVNSDGKDETSDWENHCVDYGRETQPGFIITM